MNILLPMKSKTIIVNEPPWVNKNLKKMIHARQKALSKATWPPSDLSGIGLIVTGSHAVQNITTQELVVVVVVVKTLFKSHTLTSSTISWFPRGACELHRKYTI